MSPELRHECTRVPITALANCGPLLIVAEGPYLRFFDRQENACLSSHLVFQAQAVHGIAILSESAHDVYLIIWGGVLLRTLKLSWQYDQNDHPSVGTLKASDVAKASDWILYLHPAPSPYGHPYPTRCAAVTAHNALLDITLHHGTQNQDVEEHLSILVSELTSSSRSILYSAHLLWESKDRILVAAGTAFGEIIYWSWDQSRDPESRSRIHRVFLGHEGSIFGVQISTKLRFDNQESRRLLASCSDDRTIRIWDVSSVATEEGKASLNSDIELQRTRHTGFSNASFDTDVSNVDCIAIGWGHISRVWKVEFLYGDISTNSILLLSSGEDATSRTWRLLAKAAEKMDKPDMMPWQLDLVDTAAFHNGKNVWSMSVSDVSRSHQHVTLGGADGKITGFTLRAPISPESNNSTEQSQYSIDFFASSPLAPEENTASKQIVSHRSSKQAEFLRSYAFLDDTSFFLTTNSGRVYRETLSSMHNACIERSEFLIQIDDLTGYSVCAGERSLGVAFVAGAKGSLYAYTNDTPLPAKLYTVNGKIGELFTGYLADSMQSKKMVLLVSLVGQKAAQLLYMDLSRSDAPTVSHTTIVPISDSITGLTVTSMVHVDTSKGRFALLGFRRGSIAAYRIPDQSDEQTAIGAAELSTIIDSAHGKEAVTAMIWVSDGTLSSSGHLVSIGRDGSVAMHLVDLANASINLVHNLTLPIGPNIEGLYICDSQLHVYGFSSKKFVLYNTATEEEIMSVETGGAHRSWAFQPNLSSYHGGTLIWTRASSMHIRTQTGPNHCVTRTGGHGREIKAVAVSPMIDTNEGKKQLIATGAEDTDIKIFSYSDNHLTCLRTLRKHTTGIQCLQWSADGSYLFSSGGCEEFYVWKISRLPPELGSIGVVCEAGCPPESEHSDLRIMAFDVAQQSTSGFVISMVFSNSIVKVYMYDSAQPERWCTLASGLYFTSCLTQCAFLQSGAQIMPHTILTAGTDGHAVLWPLIGPFTQQPKTLKYHLPTTIHQSSSKTLAIHALPDNTGGKLIVSGGDDGTLAFLLTSPSGPGSNDVEWACRPVIVVRTHASAVTACAAFTHNDRVFVITSGNDQWVRIWELSLRDSDQKEKGKDWIEIKRLGRVKTSVADVSSMAVLASEPDLNAARILICGVGMEIIRIE